MDAPVASTIAGDPREAVDPGEELRQRIATLLGDEERARVERAYQFAASAHAGQDRKSGEPYIIHPVAVATILADLRLDADALCAALLHDVAEDTQVGIKAIEQEFGPEIGALVDGVTRLREAEGRLVDPAQSIAARDEGAAEGVRKMFLAMAQDIRVVLIRLADRLHNMRTLDHMPTPKKRRIAQETLDIYAPLASRLGIWQIKWELEDLSFRHLDPETYRDIARRLKERRVQRERDIAQAKALLADLMRQAGIAAEIVGRPKHIYSIWRKMQSRGVEFENIYDLLAVRVIVETNADCYHALGIVHHLWPPITGQFDDYIAMPKDSMYQSLHTTVIGPSGRPLEIQIRTHEMHRLAEYGIAAHWRYKEGGRRDEKYENKIAWVRQLLDWQSDVVGGAQEFVESLKTDVFRDQVYVFTPKGEIRELPAGATPLDFAYRIHTDIGHRCVGAKVNGRIVPLDYTLKNGEILEILTSKNPKGPSRDWLNSNLNFIHTAHARDKIRQWFHRQQRDENLARGREVLDKELARLGLSKTRHEELATLFKFERVDDFLVAIGCGEISPQSVALKLLDDHTESATESTVAQPTPRSTIAPVGLEVGGVGNLLTRVARCCNPVPGEPIIGYTTRGTGITVHRADCPNIAAEDERERLVAVDWGRGKMTYPVKIRLEAWDRDGLLRDVATVVAEDKINMTNVVSQSHRDQTCTIRATLEISDIGTLGRIFSKLEGVRGVSTVTRDVS
ncbi:MAG: bifunctional (p)ppGpp synthetase/guanosine-3',5'-bis(diphosphate) 3'-pyrophosphohydrolase [Chloroflexota bacterium]|nr:MAG: bifunctional (p)ppGpp synthetase/guanosine-3',5'-bis(diphosphate) 3'-pyrophosphohydrolase [Chloroflexota bacterium]